MMTTFLFYGELFLSLMQQELAGHDSETLNHEFVENKSGNLIHTRAKLMCDE